MSPEGFREPSVEGFQDVDKPWLRSADELEAGLTAWASRVVGPEAVARNVVAPEGNGYSSETVLLDLQRGPDQPTEAIVCRLAPLPSLYPVFPDYDLPLQQRCMQLVARLTDVPVPTTPWCEEDPQWVGSPFLIMGRVDGLVPTDVPPYLFGGWVFDGTPEQHAKFQREAARVLARLHDITPEATDLSFLDRPEHGAAGIDQHLGYQRWYYEWARGDERFGIIERTFEWLDTHRPTHPNPTVLNWGDSRVGNMMWRDFEPVAVLDWEMAALGPPEIDLAWMAFLHRFFQDIAERFEMPGLPDIMTTAGLAADYEAEGGRPVRDVEWYEVFAALRFAIVSVRTTARGIAYGQSEKPADNDDYIMFRNLLEQMLDGSYWK